MHMIRCQLDICVHAQNHNFIQIKNMEIEHTELDQIIIYYAKDRGKKLLRFKRFVRAN